MSTLYEDDVAAWAQEQVVLLKNMPSLRRMLQDHEWDQEVWDDAVDIAGRETNVRNLPKVREWDFEQILSMDYFPA